MGQVRNMSQDEWDALVERAARGIYADERERKAATFTPEYRERATAIALPPWERLNDDQRRFYRDTARLILRVAAMLKEKPR